ncbi:hypothetical protein [Aeromicrobium sp.]|uniref:hypothetical protein n=1 Tax=Aeromicrobium sp. TaxID=1871063 RepID=UPI00199A293E|nr:hypothetical protein [Aeromicrobium sp.]MBC7633892.1 hypothetical protein [Aeromicrobium sp.]
MSRLVHFELDVIGKALADPAQFVDQTYDVLERLVVLHREFARRLFEVLDARDDGRPGPGADQAPWPP